MRSRQPQSLPRPLPNLWLFTDERVTDGALLAAIARLPRASGVIFRHYGLACEKRSALLGRVRTLAKRRGLVLLMSGGKATLGVDGIHLSAKVKPRRREAIHRGICSASAHNAREIAAASRSGAQLIFLSPVFPTRSHEGAATLGPIGFATLARLSRCPVIALGGMNASRFRRLKPLGAYGWAGIDAFTRHG